MKKKFDSVTAKKIINEYAEKLNYYMRDNTNLKLELEDVKTTLKLNKELFYSYISQNKTDKDYLYDEIQEENKRLTKKIDDMFADRAMLEKKVIIVLYQLYRTEQALDDKIIAESEGMDKLKEKIFYLENKLKEKENLIGNMKIELEKYFYESSSDLREIYIAEPDRYNLEMYNELCLSKELYEKVCKMLNNEKAISAKHLLVVKELEDRIKLLKQGIKAGKKDTLSVLELSSDDDDVTDRSQITINCDSPVVIFPEKVHMKKRVVKGDVPKLDLTKVKEKYKDNANNKVIVADKINKSNRSNNEYIEKLKFQLKVCKNTIKTFKRKMEKLNRIISLQKQEIARSKSKIELLEIQMKKTGASTYDRSNNNVNNTSMVIVS